MVSARIVTKSLSRTQGTPSRIDREMCPTDRFHADKRDRDSVLMAFIDARVLHERATGISRLKQSRCLRVLTLGQSSRISNATAIVNAR